MKLSGSFRSKLNLSIDIIMFILLLAMAGIGFLIKYVVVSGEVRNVKYGPYVDLEFLGLTRHQWGSIHLIVSIIFLVLLVLHIVFHWRCILSIYKCLFPSPFTRSFIAVMLVFLTLFALISPFLLKPDTVPSEPEYRNRNFYFPESSQSNATDVTEHVTFSNVSQNEISLDVNPSEDPESRSVVLSSEGTIHHGPEYDQYEVFGYNTLNEIAERYSISANSIADKLGIPANLSSERLSWLRKRYPFTMSDVRKTIGELTTQKNRLR